MILAFSGKDAQRLFPDTGFSGARSLGSAWIAAQEHQGALELCPAPHRRALRPVLTVSSMGLSHFSCKLAISRDLLGGFLFKVTPTNR